MQLPVNERISRLREEMRKAGLQAYIITGTDAHISEYVAPHWRTREFISGFTGSAGQVLVTEDRAFLWTDSRYFIQAASQLAGSGVELMKMDVEGFPSLEEYIEKNLAPSSRSGICAENISIHDFCEKREEFSRYDLELAATDELLSPIWTDRPALPQTKIRMMSDETAGASRAEKLAQIRASLKEKGADYTFIATVDDIACITNLRADDVECNPVFISFMFISQDQAVLFTSLARFNADTLETVRRDIQVRPYEAAYEDLPLLASGKAYYNDEKVNARLMDVLSVDKAVTGRDFSTDLKARKNPVELEGMRKSHLMDGAAFINAFSQIDFSLTDGTYDEIFISDLFARERAKMPGYQGPSFNPISGFGPNGAMCHYSATAESNAKIDRSGLLVLDTGSQFDYGMTDLTRTLLFGQATAEQKKDYTLVLKGHLALARSIFIQGTRGYQLDVLAKQFMWKEGMSFYHGTGHGVGFNLNVHEGPMKISAHPVDVALAPGMVLSDEPGIYKEGSHGIRIENLLAVQKAFTTDFGTFLSFETLSLVPYERKLIDRGLLSDEEIRQIDEYHERVYSSLSPLVDGRAEEYLRKATLPLADE